MPPAAVSPPACLTNGHILLPSHSGLRHPPPEQSTLHLWLPSSPTPAAARVQSQSAILYAYLSPAGTLTALVSSFVSASSYNHPGGNTIRPSLRQKAGLAAATTASPCQKNPTVKQVHVHACHHFSERILSAVQYALQYRQFSRLPSHFQPCSLRASRARWAIHGPSSLSCPERARTIPVAMGPA